MLTLMAIEDCLIVFTSMILVSLRSEVDFRVAKAFTEVFFPLGCGSNRSDQTVSLDV